MCRFHLHQADLYLNFIKNKVNVFYSNGIKFLKKKLYVLNSRQTILGKSHSCSVPTYTIQQSFDTQILNCIVINVTRIHMLYSSRELKIFAPEQRFGVAEDNDLILTSCEIGFFLYLVNLHEIFFYKLIRHLFAISFREICC